MLCLYIKIVRVRIVRESRENEIVSLTFDISGGGVVYEKRDTQNEVNNKHPSFVIWNLV